MRKDAMLQRFVLLRPLAVMVRSITQEILNDELDVVFEEHRQRQYERELLFSQLAITMADVVLGLEKSPHQAYKTHREQLRVSTTSFYDKLNRVETSISEGMVRYAYKKAKALQESLGFVASEPIQGYHARAIDGNHLQKTQKRIGELRGLASAALPGTVVATYELGSNLFDRAYILEDAHAQESTVLGRVLQDMVAKDLMIGDRHFCILWFLRGIADAHATFAIRQHGRLKGELLGKRRKIGRIATGMVYEQKLIIGRTEDDAGMTVRRVTVELDEPTRDGDTEIHILTNVPCSHATARKIAEIYRQRWDIENGFYVLTTTMTCEVKGLGRPLAALFVFCLAMVAYNGMRVMMAALTSTHGEEAAAELSAYSMSQEIAKSTDGLQVIFTKEEWNALIPNTTKALARFLIDVAKHVDLKRHQKSRRGPKKKPPRRTGYKIGGHVSTAKLLAARK